MFPINRVVALATPLFSALAAVGSAWLLQHFPGLPVPSSAELVSIEIAAATAAAGAALKWLHGHQKLEADLRHAESFAEVAVADVSKVDPHLLGDIEALVESKVQALLEHVTFKPAATTIADQQAAPPVPAAVS